MAYGFTSYNQSDRQSQYGYSNTKYTEQSVSSILSNGATGASIGATIGSVIPGVGTIIGGMIGGVAGFIFGGRKNDFMQKQKEAKYNSALERLIQGEGDLVNQYNQELERYNLAQERRIDNYNTENQKSTLALLNTQMSNAQATGKQEQQMALSGFRNTAGATNARDMATEEGRRAYASQKLTVGQNSSNAFSEIQSAFVNQAQSKSNLDVMIDRYKKAYEDLKNGNDISQELEVLDNWTNFASKTTSLAKNVSG